MKFRIKYLIKFLLFKLSFILYWGKVKKIKKAIQKQENLGVKNIPIFIINFNRLSYVKNQVSMLISKGYNNIHIIDNNSSYTPLLKWYENCHVDVIRLKRNYGHKVFWKCDLFEKYRNEFYVITDPDVEPICECPDNFVQIFFEYFKIFPLVWKIGFSLKIDDLPQNATLTSEVVKWERKFNERIFKISKAPLHYAEIDTTFALYGPDYLYDSLQKKWALRTDYPIQARHLPWYKCESDVTEEDLYYSKNKTNGWWDFVKGKVTTK